MSGSAEKLLTFFTERGYQPILIGRSDLVPPDVFLLGEDRYRWFGPLRDLLKPESKIFETSSGDVPELELVETHAHDAQTSFNFFNKLLERFGLTGSGKAKTNLTRDETLRLRRVTVRSVSPVAIEAALNEGLDVEKLGEDRTQHVHIAYQYLYSSEVEIILGDRTNVSIGLSAKIPTVVEGDANAASKKEGVDATSYKKDNPVVIAFKAAQLVKHNSRWRLRLTRASGSGIAPGAVGPYIFRPGEILTIDD